MASDQDDSFTTSRLQHAGEHDEQEEHDSNRSLYLGHGRTLTVSQEGLDDVVEIRATSGAVEMRVKMTDAGPVLHLEGVRLSVKAAESIDMQCKTFSVDASESLDLHSGGQLKVISDSDMRIESTSSELKVRAKMIYLN